MMVRTRNEDGAALILAICLTLVASVIGASLIMLAQTETYASLNYRLMSQARYAAESGVQKAVNFLLYSYTPPTEAQVAASYNTDVSPVTYSSSPTILSARSDQAANYPASDVQAAFAAAAQGTIMADQMPLQYAASAKLLSMQAIDIYGSNGTKAVVQTWEITADGTTGGTRPAKVQVTAILERQVTNVASFGFFATDPNCGALTFQGGMTTDSYDSDSMTMVSGHPAVDLWGGNVGSNGNLTEGGTGTVVHGFLGTPRTGVGNCAAGSVDALTQNGGAQVSAGVISLPQAVTYPAPALPNPLPPTSNVGITKNTTCADLGLSSPACTGIKADPTACVGTVCGLVFNPNGTTWTMGDIALSGGAQINLKAGTYALNSFSMAGNSALNIDSSGGEIVMNVVGTGKTTPVDFTGGVVSNPSYVPSTFQLQFAGTSGLKLAGGSSTAMMVYAPNASVDLTGGSDFYGSILGKTIKDGGGTHLHYDRHIPSEFATTGAYVLSSFTWKKF